MSEYPNPVLRASTARPPNVKAWCRICGRGWSGLSEAHCSLCHTHLSGIEAFDRHQVSRHELTCLDVTSAKDRNGNPMFAAKTGPHGTTWRRWRADIDGLAWHTNLTEGVA